MVARAGPTSRGPRPDLNGPTGPEYPAPVWLVTEDGSRLYVRWPYGFSARFEPVLTLLDERGEAFASRGGTIVFGQIGRGWNAGTPADPYVARGTINGRCYG